MATGRIERLRELLRLKNYDAIILSNCDNIRYISGHSGDAATLVISQAAAHLITDSRYSEQARSESPDFVVIQRDRATATLGSAIDKLLRDEKIARLAFEEESLSYAAYSELCRDITAAQLVAARGVVEELRYCKDEEEIVSLRRAAAIAEAALARLIDEVLEPGVSERYAALKLDSFMRELGSEGLSFETILLSGPRTSLPHGLPSERRIEEGDLILIDFGARIDGYGSDITRTMVMGQGSAKQHEIYNLVYAAQRSALAELRAGVAARELHRAAEAVLLGSPYGVYRGDSLGHGLGLFLHEQPIMRGDCPHQLVEGAVLTVEPGIYIPGWGGVRIEDDLIVSVDGHELITAAPSELVSVGELRKTL